MNIGVLMYHEVSELELSLPYGVLDTARQIMLANAQDAFGLCTIAKSRNSVQTSADMTITPTWAFASAPRVDIMIVPGGSGAEQASRDRALIAYLQTAAATTDLLVSVSSGALILGKLGLLEGQVVTTHPDLYDSVEQFEVLRVSRERLVKNEGLWCARTAAVGLELGLELVKQIAGESIAKQTAAYLGITTTQPGLF